MRRYGTDKPDLRNPLEICDLTDLFAESGFKAFAGKTVQSHSAAGRSEAVALVLRQARRTRKDRRRGRAGVAAGRSGRIR